MKKNFHFTAIILTLGLLLFSSGVAACEMKAKKSCCKKEISVKLEEKDCCQNNQSNEKSKSCEGKCGHLNCTSASANFSFIQNNDVNFTLNTFVLSFRKQKFYFNETATSNGFFSLWLIPKIS